MNRRTFMLGLLCATALTSPEVADAHNGGRLGWPRPNVAPFNWGTDAAGQQQALALFEDLLRPYPGLYGELRSKVLSTPGRREELRPLPQGFQITRMGFGSRQYLSNMDIRQSDLQSPDWTGKTRWMTVWTLTRLVNDRLLVVTFIRHDVCRNPSIILRWMQGECIVDYSLCGPGCEEIRRAQTVR